MFSRRLQWDDSQNALTRMRSDLEHGSTQILDLTVSNPTAVGLDYPISVVMNLSRGDYARHGRR